MLFLFSEVLYLYIFIANINNCLVHVKGEMYHFVFYIKFELSQCGLTIQFLIKKGRSQAHIACLCLLSLNPTHTHTHTHTYMHTLWNLGNRLATAWGALFP